MPKDITVFNCSLQTERGWKGEERGGEEMEQNSGGWVSVATSSTLSQSLSGDGMGQQLVLYSDRHLRLACIVLVVTVTRCVGQVIASSSR